MAPTLLSSSRLESLNKRLYMEKGLHSVAQGGDMGWRLNAEVILGVLLSSVQFCPFDPLPQHLVWEVDTPW